MGARRTDGSVRGRLRTLRREPEFRKAGADRDRHRERHDDGDRQRDRRRRNIRASAAARRRARGWALRDRAGGQGRSKDLCHARLACRALRSEPERDRLSRPRPRRRRLRTDHRAPPPRSRDRRRGSRRADHAEHGSRRRRGAVARRPRRGGRHRRRERRPRLRRSPRPQRQHGVVLALARDRSRVERRRARQRRLERRHLHGPASARGAQAEALQSRRRSRGPAPTRPYRIETSGVDKAATLTKRGQKIAPLGDYAAAATSSSGRYVALRGHRDEADAVHFLVVLVDLDTGEITPLGKRAWPAAIDPKLLVGPRDGLAALAEDTVAETPLRWVSADARSSSGRSSALPGARRCRAPWTATSFAERRRDRLVASIAGAAGASTVVPSALGFATGLRRRRPRCRTIGDMRAPPHPLVTALTPLLALALFTASCSGAFNSEALPDPSAEAPASPSRRAHRRSRAHPAGAALVDVPGVDTSNEAAAAGRSSSRAS